MRQQSQCYEHIAGIIGIKTDIQGFRWGFGKCENPVSEDVYDKCKIKVNLELKNDSEVFNIIDTGSYTEVFRHFKVNPQTNSLIFEKKLAKLINLKFVLTVGDNTVDVVVGKSYLKYVKAKMMYIHSIAYILFDIVSILLLKNGMTTLYCSAAQMESGKNAVFVAPPNTGKSLTVLKLKNDFNAEIIAEDMSVTDGHLIWGAPYTNLYRNYNDKTLQKPVAGGKDFNGCKIDSVIIMQKSREDSFLTAGNFLEKVLLINRYSLGYYYSPVVRALNYYNDDFSIKEAQKTEESLIGSVLDNAQTILIKKPNPMDFSKTVNSLLCE